MRIFNTQRLSRVNVEAADEDALREALHSILSRVDAPPSIAPPGDDPPETAPPEPLDDDVTPCEPDDADADDDDSGLEPCPTPEPGS